MKIDVFKSNEQILEELGTRLRVARIRSGQTQAQLAKASGVSKTTVERAERGESVQLLNIVKLLRSLRLLGGLEVLVPPAEKTPLEYLEKIFVPQRVRPRKGVSQSSFVWGDEK